jgi:hypothetical protein
MGRQRCALALALHLINGECVRAWHVVADDSPFDFKHLTVCQMPYARPVATQRTLLRLLSA